SGEPALASAAAGPTPSARSRSVVGQRQTVDRVPPSSAMSACDRWVAWTAVKRRPSAPAWSSNAAGVSPVATRESRFPDGCAELDALQRATVEPALQVAGVEQGEPEARSCSGGDERLAHRIGVAVRLAARTVVQVMELARGAVARQRHLAVGGAGEAEEQVGVKRPG